jgi:hypothetical protein
MICSVGTAASCRQRCCPPHPTHMPLWAQQLAAGSHTCWWAHAAAWLTPSAATTRPPLLLPHSEHTLVCCPPRDVQACRQAARLQVCNQHRMESSGTWRESSRLHGRQDSLSTVAIALRSSRMQAPGGGVCAHHVSVWERPGARNAASRSTINCRECKLVCIISFLV